MWRSWGDARGLPRDQTAFILEDCTPFEAVFLSSTVVTVHSTITLDALACRRPMVLMPFLAEGNPLNYAKQYGVAVDVHCVEELADAVASVAGDERVRQRLLANFSAAIDRELHGLDGTSASAMIAGIEQLIESQRRQAAA